MRGEKRPGDCSAPSLCLDDVTSLFIRNGMERPIRTRLVVHARFRKLNSRERAEGNKSQYNVVAVPSGIVYYYRYYIPFGTQARDFLFIAFPPLPPSLGAFYPATQYTKLSVGYLVIDETSPTLPVGQHKRRSDMHN